MAYLLGGAMSKYIWVWGYDGTVMYVYEVYQTRFTKRHRLNQIKHWYTNSFTDVQKVAEEFIEKLESAGQG